MKKEFFLLFLFVTLGLSRILVVYSSASMEIDAQGSVTKVVDGDTLDVSNFGRIRLADIDAPETGEAGYNEAKNYLNSLVYNRLVYIDMDEKLDPYDRFVCVIYVRWNSTHLLNVNEALLNKDVAVISNYQNEFNPDTWTLYVYQPASNGNGNGGGTGDGSGNGGGTSNDGDTNRIPFELQVIALLIIFLILIILYLIKS